MRRASRVMIAFGLVSAAMAVEAQTVEELVASKHVIVRARVEPPVVYVGQKAELQVDILTRTWFLKAPQYPDTVAIRDAVVLPPEGFGINFSERIDGETYAAQTRALVVFPTRVGTFEVPPFPVTLAVADRNAKRMPDFALMTPALTFTARLPDTGRGLVVATSSLSVEQRWAPAFDGLRAGDALTRTVTSIIEDSVGMLLPDIRFVAPDGVSVYEDRPVTADRRERGQLSGSRTESATFVFEREGVFDFPDIAVQWWDLAGNRLRTETLTGVEVTVAPNPDLARLQIGLAEEEETGGGAPVIARERRAWRTMLLGLAALALLAAGFRPLRRLLARLAARPSAGNRPEARSFRRFRQEAATGDAGRALASLYAWFDLLDRSGSPLIERLAERAADPELADELHGLQAAAVGMPGQWSARILVPAVRRARRRLRARARSGGSGRGAVTLNPSRTTASGTSRYCRSVGATRGR